MTDTEISVIGLGRMGSALAHCFIRHNKSVSVFNRHANKAEPFKDLAKIASSVAEACQMSPLTVMCVSDYSCAESILGGPGVASALRGKTLVQMSSGTPDDARRSEAWAKEHGIGYIDGAIITYPAGVGLDDTIVFYSGNEQRYEHHAEHLACLGGKARYVGEAVGAAAAIDCGLLEFMYASVGGMLHGAALCEAESFPIADYFKMINDIYPLINGSAVAAEQMVNRRDFSGNQCSVAVHLAAIRNIQRASQDAGIATEMPDALVRMHERPIERGQQEDELPVVFEGQLKP